MVYTQYLPWRKRNEDILNQDPTPPRSDYDFYEVVRDDFRHDVDILDKIISKMNELPYNKLLRIKTENAKRMNYRIMHAWYKPGLGASEEKQKQYNLYKRNFDGKADSREVYVHGHTPTIVDEYYLRGIPIEERPGMIGYRPNSINVDGGCCYHLFQCEHPCMLCALCLETLDEFYCDTVENRLRIAAKHYIKEYLHDEDADFTKAIVEKRLERYQNARESTYRRKLLERL